MKSRKCAHFDTLGILAYGAEGAVSARPQHKHAQYNHHQRKHPAFANTTRNPRK